MIILFLGKKRLMQKAALVGGGEGEPAHNGHAENVDVAMLCSPLEPINAS